MEIKPLYPVSSYQVAFAQVKGFLLSDKHVVVGLHGARLWGKLYLRGLVSRYLPCDRVRAHLDLLPELKVALLLSLVVWSPLLQSKLERSRVFNWRSVLLATHFIEDI